MKLSKPMAFFLKTVLLFFYVFNLKFFGAEFLPTIRIAFLMLLLPYGLSAFRLLTREVRLNPLIFTVFAAVFAWAILSTLFGYSNAPGIFNTVFVLFMTLCKPNRDRLALRVSRSLISTCEGTKDNKSTVLSNTTRVIPKSLGFNWRIKLSVTRSAPPALRLGRTNIIDVTGKLSPFRLLTREVRLNPLIFTGKLSPKHNIVLTC
jgi:hypothetical protein